MQKVFENEHFVAIDKPAGWLTIPGREGDKDPRRCLSRELRAESAKIFPVHRLDVEVSGLVLFAKSAEAHRSANAWFEGREVKKFYDALTEGAPPASRETQLWKSKLLRGKKRAYESAEGKEAVTQATWLATRPGGQLWKLEPLTGRSHQLRYELARHGYPILGDRLYGSTKTYEPHSIALRAVRLELGGCTGAGDVYGLPGVLEVKGISDV